MFKGPYADHILIPQVATGSSAFCLVSDKSPYFSHDNPKISASNSLYFGSYRRKCTDFWYTNIHFVCIFITASSQVSHTCFCPRRENKK